MTNETRPATIAAETREDGQLVLRGYAALYDTETVIGGLFRERIAPGAFDEAIGRDDVRALFNHNPDVVLGRTVSGTLRLAVDTIGLRYEVTLNPLDSEHVRVHQMIARGDVSQSSFGFEVTGHEWGERKANELPLRTITKTKLYDVSPVTYPAYAETSVTARDLPQSGTDAAEVLAAKAAADVVPVRLRRLELDARS